MSRDIPDLPKPAASAKREVQMFNGNILASNMLTRTHLIGQSIGPILLKLMSRRDEPGYSDDAAMVEAMRLAIYCVDSWNEGVKT